VIHGCEVFTIPTQRAVGIFSLTQHSFIPQLNVMNSVFGFSQPYSIARVISKVVYTR